jgi:hypothetical protein
MSKNIPNTFEANGPRPSILATCASSDSIVASEKTIFGLSGESLPATATATSTPAFSDEEAAAAAAFFFVAFASAGAAAAAVGFLASTGVEGLAGADKSPSSSSSIKPFLTAPVAFFAVVGESLAFAAEAFGPAAALALWQSRGRVVGARQDK